METPGAEQQTGAFITQVCAADAERSLNSIAPIPSQGLGISEELVETLNAGQPPPLSPGGQCAHQTEPVSFALQASELLAEPPGTLSDLTSEELKPIVEEAKSRWSEWGLLDAAGLDVLDSLSFEIVDLDDLMLGSTSAYIIQIDVNAAGHGWFVDSTPSDDDELGLESNGQLIAEIGSDAFERIDLLTAVTHEIGHSLGYMHLDSDLDPGDLMNGILDTGVRRNIDAELPTHEALQALRTSLADLSESLDAAAVNLKSALEIEYSDPLAGLSESLNELFGSAGLSAYLDLDVHLSDFVSTFDWSDDFGPTDVALALTQRVTPQIITWEGSFFLSR